MGFDGLSVISHSIRPEFALRDEVHMILLYTFIGNAISNNLNSKPKQSYLTVSVSSVDQYKELNGSCSPGLRIACGCLVAKKSGISQPMAMIDLSQVFELSSRSCRNPAEDSGWKLQYKTL